MAAAAGQRLVVALGACLCAVVAHAADTDTDTAADGTRRVLVMELQYGGTVTPDNARTITELVTGRVSRSGMFTVVSAAEMTQVAMLEAEKRRLQCTENSCLSEIADSLGARYVIFGRVSNLGEILVVQLRMFDARDAKFLERVTVESPSLDGLSPQLEPAVDRLLAPLLDPSEKRVLLQHRTAANDDDEGGAWQLWAGGGALGAALLVAAGATAGALYFEGERTSTTNRAAERQQATVRGRLVVIGGGVGAGLLALSGVALVVWGLLD